jgi:5-methylcytosine-specific restriction endonuclease McrA
MTVCQDVLKILDEKAKEGEAEVKRACRIFLKKKTVSGVKPEKRKPVPKEWTMEAYMNQEGFCPLCDRPMELFDKQNPVVPDHIVPIVKGGKTERRNIQASHKICNSQKQDMDMNEWSKYKQTHKIGI